MKRLLSLAILGTGLLASAAAFANEGYVTASVNLRAGPDMGYPAVVRLHAGTPVDIRGCVDGWSWCDVEVGYDRGWVSSAYLQEEYEGRRVLIRDYGVRIGLPIVSFAFGDYWDNHYRSRSWYGHRDRYSHIRPRYYSSYNHGSYDRGSYDRGSYDRGSYSHSGSYSGSHDTYRNGTYRNGTYRSGSTRDGTYRSGTYRNDGSTNTYVQRSPGYRSGDGSRHSTVTTSTYRQGTTTTPSYRTERSYNSTPRSVQRDQATVQQTYTTTTAPVHNANPQRSASGEQHSMGGQQRAAEVHARNAERRAARAQEKSDNRGHNKDKRNDNDQGR